MPLCSSKSLSATVDALGEAHFLDHSIPARQRKAAADWIVSRIGQPGSYAGLPALTPDDLASPVPVFTGDVKLTCASARHVMGEEACRALLLLGDSRTSVRDGLARASAGMLEKIGSWKKPDGSFCCGKCSVGLWRHLAAGGLTRQEELLSRGMDHLKGRRRGDGTWVAFPTWYTLLILVELDLPGARREMQYAAPVAERYVRRKQRDDLHARRRTELARRVLARCG